MDGSDRTALLRERPSLESEVQRLTAVRDAAVAALGDRLALAGWEPGRDGGQALCGDGTGEGRVASLPSLLRRGGVPDDQWDAAVEVLAEVGAEAGFGEPETVVDAPGEHEVVLRGERESLLRFGTLANATIALETGCHLPEGSD